MDLLRHTLLAAAGGGLGAATRFLVGVATRRAVGAGFPWATLLVNVAGCLLIGWWLAEQRSAPREPAATVFVAVGFLGGLTTFSAFGFETLALARGAGLGPALVNVTLQLVLGLTAVACGLWLGGR